MVRSKNLLMFTTLLFFVLSCNEKVTKETNSVPKVQKKSTTQIKEELTEKGFQIFDYVDEKTKDTVLT